MVFYFLYQVHFSIPLKWRPGHLPPCPPSYTTGLGTATRIAVFHLSGVRLSMQGKNLKLICTYFLFYFSGNVFPSDFETIIQRIVRLLFNVLAHIYHAHFMQLAQLDLYQHLNCVFSHIVVFCQENKTIEFTKDINALDDLIDALELNLSKPSNSSNSASSSS